MPRLFEALLCGVAPWSLVPCDPKHRQNVPATTAAAIVPHRPPGLRGMCALVSLSCLPYKLHSGSCVALAGLFGRSMPLRVAPQQPQYRSGVVESARRVLPGVCSARALHGAQPALLGAQPALLLRRRFLGPPGPGWAAPH